MRILYLCPHGAAKSVIAVALTRQLAERGGFEVTCDNAGTEPDAAVSPVALGALGELGLAYVGTPRLVEPSDILGADVVVSLGCAVEAMPAVPHSVIDWSDVPDGSSDVAGLVDVLQHRVAELIRSAPPRDAEPV